MFLSNFIHQPIYNKGTCKGLGFSLKNGNIKYLLCASGKNLSAPDFAIRFSAVEKFFPLTLSSLRPVVPKQCAKLVLGMPVFSGDGTHLGNLSDVEFNEFQILRLYTSKGFHFPFLSVFAATDAVITRKPLPFPLGQRIPAPNKQGGTVTKKLLKEAIKKGELIRLTLSLSPFSLSV